MLMIRLSIAYPLILLAALLALLFIGIMRFAMLIGDDELIDMLDRFIDSI